MDAIAPLSSDKSVLGEAGGEVGVQRGEELLGGLPWLVGANEHGEILGHGAALHRFDDHVLQRLSEVNHLRCVVELAPVLQAAGPGVDGSDRVG